MASKLPILDLDVGHPNGTDFSAEHVESAELEDEGIQSLRCAGSLFVDLLQWLKMIGQAVVSVLQN